MIHEKLLVDTYIYTNVPTLSMEVDATYNYYEMILYSFLKSFACMYKRK